MYALCGIVGLLIAGGLFCFLLKKRNRSDSDGLLMLVFTGIGVVIGSHFLYGLTHLKYWVLVFKADLELAEGGWE